MRHDKHAPMTHSPRRTIIAAATVTAVALAGCANPFPGIRFTPEETTTSTGMENAPYPADLIALGKTTLPEGATDITVSPALKTAEASPGAWGYVITYHAQPQPIREHFAKYTGLAKVNVEELPDAEYSLGINDVDFTDIQQPWITGLENAKLIVERPLGRCWLIIRGGFR